MITKTFLLSRWSNVSFESLLFAMETFFERLMLMSLVSEFVYWKSIISFQLTVLNFSVLTSLLLLWYELIALVYHVLGVAIVFVVYIYVCSSNPWMFYLSACVLENSGFDILELKELCGFFSLGLFSRYYLTKEGQRYFAIFQFS